MNEKTSTRKNTREVRTGFLKFCAGFLVLCMLSFAVLYLFFQSNAVQSDNIRKDVLAYKQILNKQGILKTKIDTIYDQMSLLNRGKVNNDIFLGNYISGNIQEARNIIGNDSTSEFRHYSFLLDRLDTMLALKNNLVLIGDKEQLALKDLNECIGKITKVKSDLSQDPTRGFQSK